MSISELIAELEQLDSNTDVRNVILSRCRVINIEDMVDSRMTFSRSDNLRVVPHAHDA